MNKLKWIKVYKEHEEKRDEEGDGVDKYRKKQTVEISESAQ